MTEAVDIELLSFLAAGGGTIPTTLEEFASLQFLNVKWFGALGNGSDDTDEIQECLDIAFGSYSSPHGVTTANKGVFFPAGNYVVSPRWYDGSTSPSVTVTGTANNAGKVRVTVSSALTQAQLDTGGIVYVNGVAGTIEANGAWGVIRDSSTTFTLVNCNYVNAFSGSGGTLKPPCLRVRQVHSGYIFGAGKLSTGVTTSTAAAITLCLNGSNSSRIEAMSFGTGASGIAFDLNYSAQVGDAITQTEGNTFTACTFGGSGTGAGISIGWGGGACRTNLVFCCFVASDSGNPGDGLAIRGAESVNNSMIGGNIAACKNGIHVYAGSCSTITSVGIQNYQVTPHQDIFIEDDVTEAHVISGCRSESENFLKVGAACTATISVEGNALLGANTAAYFFRGGGQVTINGCTSLGPKILGEGAALSINGCSFVGSFIDASSTFTYLSISPKPVKDIAATSYTIDEPDGGSKLRFTAGTTVTVTLSSACTLGPGTEIEVQQTSTGAGLVNFTTSGVTLRTEASPKGAKLRNQWSCARLMCDAANVWSLTGDTAA